MISLDGFSTLPKAVRLVIWVDGLESILPDKPSRVFSDLAKEILVMCCGVGSYSVLVRPGAKLYLVSKS